MDSGVESHPGANPDKRFEISIKTRFPNAGKQRQAKQELLELMAGKASESQIREKYKLKR